jgi:2,3-bisphosphoglycerate-dependent phosphoglycerate mutase
MTRQGSPPSGVLVLLRHAQSQWNAQNRFSGWADMDLSDKGIAEAHQAGARLRAEGFRFDRAFVSPLRRATQTLDIVRAELGQAELPVVVDWHLNERHYGALQGLDKAETAARYGAEQLHRWRRGYHDTPPPLAPNDPRHPRFDARYADVPLDQLPATESLADTERRVVPYFEEQIAPPLAAGQTVLVVSHGNTLRALVKYLEGMDDHAVEQREIPTGLPLVYRFSAGMRPLRACYLDLPPPVAAA